MPERGAKGPTTQKKVTSPVHHWKLLEHFAELQTDAYELMGGSTAFTVSDLFELATEYFLQKVTEDLGPIPGPEASASERRAFVAKLAEDNKKKLLERLLGQAPSDKKKP